MRRPESNWLYRARVALVHSELPAWLCVFAIGAWFGAVLFYGGRW